MDSVVIDIVVAVLLVAFAGIGAARGAVREVMATGGILLAAFFNERWGALWSSDTASVFGLGPLDASLATFLTIFGAIVLLVNYAAPAMLLRHVRLPKDRTSRSLGLLFGIFNGSLVAAYLLTYLQAFGYNSNTASPILASASGPFLLDWASWGLLAVVIGLLFFTIASAFVRSSRTLTGPDVQAVYGPNLVGQPGAQPTVAQPSVITPGSSPLLNYSRPAQPNAAPASNAYSPTAANPVYSTLRPSPAPPPAPAYLGNSYPVQQATYPRSDSGNYPGAPASGSLTAFGNGGSAPEPPTNLMPTFPGPSSGLNPASNTAARTCPHCGTELFTSGPFCINCGKRLN